MKPRIAALAAIVLVLLVGAFTTMRASNRRPSPQSAEGPAAAREVATPVQVAVATRGSMVRTLEVTGNLKTDHDVKITSKIPGKVAAVAVKEGDRVTAGQLLVTLDDVDTRTQVEQSEASLRSLEERLAQAKAGESLRYTQTDAQIEQAEANLRAARLRVEQLESSARITDASAKSAVARAESGLKSAKDRLSIVKEGARDQERRVAENAVEQAKVNLDTMRTRVERRRSLFKQGAISQEELDENEKALKLAQAQYNSAVQQRDLLREGARSEEVRIAEEQVRQADEGLREAQANLERTEMSHDDVAAARENVAQMEAAVRVARANKAQYDIVPRELAAMRASVDEARARVRYAREQVTYTEIHSPIDGVVATKAVNAGESISTMNVLLNVVSLQGAYFEAQVPELAVGQVRPGQKVRVTVDSLPNRALDGTVSEIIPVAAAESKSFRVRVAVAAAGALPIGAFARGLVETGGEENALLIPKDCLQSMAGESFVYLVTDGTVKRQSVKLGDTDAVNAHIVEGLEDGARVVSSGASLLNDGAKVKIVALER